MEMAPNENGELIDTDGKLFVSLLAQPTINKNKQNGITIFLINIILLVIPIAILRVNSLNDFIN